MAARRNHRKKRRSPAGAIIIVLTAIAIMCVLAVCLMKLDITGTRRYPVRYTEEIILRAGENSIPAPYIAAIIMAESSYDPGAVSSVGARGLMQIMPETGGWIAGKFGDEFAEDALFTPDGSYVHRVEAVRGFEFNGTDASGAQYYSAEFRVFGCA